MRRERATLIESQLDAYAWYAGRQRRRVSWRRASYHRYESLEVQGGKWPNTTTTTTTRGLVTCEQRWSVIDPIAYHFARMQPCNFETSATSSMNLTGVSTRADGDGICSARPEELYSCGVEVPPWLVGKTRRDVFENGFQ